MVWILMEVQLSKKNIMKRNGQGEEKVHAPYGAKDILLLTSARLRRTFFQKDGEIALLNIFKNTLYKPQWSRLSSAYSHGAVTHSSSRPSEAWKHLQNEGVLSWTQGRKLVPGTANCNPAL